MLNNNSVNEVDNEFHPDLFDHYLHMKLAIDHGREYLDHARVTKQLRNH